MLQRRLRWLTPRRCLIDMLERRGGDLRLRGIEAADRPDRRERLSRVLSNLPRHPPERVGSDLVRRDANVIAPVPLADE